MPQGSCFHKPETRPLLREPNPDIAVVDVSGAREKSWSSKTEIQRPVDPFLPYMHCSLYSAQCPLSIVCLQLPLFTHYSHLPNSVTPSSHAWPLAPNQYSTQETGKHHALNSEIPFYFPSSSAFLLSFHIMYWKYQDECLSYINIKMSIGFESFSQNQDCTLQTIFHSHSSSKMCSIPLTVSDFWFLILLLLGRKCGHQPHSLSHHSH